MKTPQVPAMPGTTPLGLKPAATLTKEQGREKAINDTAVKIEEAARLLWNAAKENTPEEQAARSIINGAQVIARLTSEVR